MLHINHLKGGYNPAPEVHTVVWSNKQPTPLTSGILPWTTETPAKEESPCDTSLTHTQKCQIRQLLSSFPGLSSTTLRRTNQVQHVIENPA